MVELIRSNIPHTVYNIVVQNVTITGQVTIRRKLFWYKTIQISVTIKGNATVRG